MGVEGEPVDDGGYEAGVGDDLVPFAEGQVGADSDRGGFVSVGEDLEEQFGAACVELDVAEFIDDQEFDARTYMRGIG